MIAAIKAAHRDRVYKTNFWVDWLEGLAEYLPGSGITSFPGSIPGQPNRLISYVLTTAEIRRRALQRDVDDVVTEVFDREDFPVFERCCSRDAFDFFGGDPSTHAGSMGFQIITVP